MPLFCLDLSVVGKEVFKYTVVNTNLSVSPFSFIRFLLHVLFSIVVEYMHIKNCCLLERWTRLSCVMCPSVADKFLCYDV